MPLNLPPTSRQIWIKNRGITPQAVNSIAISGAQAAEFSLAIGGDKHCGSLSPTLAAGDSCTLLLGFSPTTSGAKTAALEITANGTTNAIPLSGTAIATIHGVVPIRLAVCRYLERQSPSALLPQPQPAQTVATASVICRPPLTASASVKPVIRPAPETGW